MFGALKSGIIIAVTPGKKSSRRKPYKLVNSRRVGDIKLRRIVNIHKKSNDELVGSAPNKTEAMELAKRLMIGCKEDLYGKTIYVSDDIDFELNYSPSSNSSIGQYIIFGVDENDVRVYTRRKRGFE